ncbi:Poly(A)-specific ribonuclease PARN [Halotydeus destructor]|nr:Poly(A)-specific ribonuclease PARN [Halotydeus destructor]
MDVTRDNFVALLPEIEEAIKTSDFVAIDTEFSGLRKGKSGNLFDVHEERYTKLKTGCMDYSLIQLGLSCFKKLPEGRNYCCHSYNLYVFPYKVSGIPKTFDRSFELQPAAIQFLRLHGFDFNHLFDKGINWLTVEETTEVEKLLMDSLEKIEAVDDKGSFTVKAEHQEYVNNVMQQIEDFVNSDETKKLDLAASTPYQRKMIYDSLQSKDFYKDISIQTCTEKIKREHYLSITKSSKEERLMKTKDILTEATGISGIVQLLVKYAKPVIGHNLLLDLMHVINQFVTPLPATYKEFKQTVHSLFPAVYDTKFIASTLDFKQILPSTTLGDMFNSVKKSPFHEVSMEKKTSGEGDLHQAGYDSYITGTCFAAMNEFLRERYKSDSESICGEVRRYVNMLHLTYTFDMTHWNLGQDDVVLDRKHVFHVTFPEQWTTNDLTQLFSAFGYVTVGWQDSTSALVGLKNSAKWKEVKKSFQKGPVSLSYAVSTYDEYLKNVKNAKSSEVASEEASKRKSPVETTETESENNAVKKSKVEKLFAESSDW